MNPGYPEEGQKTLKDSSQPSQGGFTDPAWTTSSGLEQPASTHRPVRTGGPRSRNGHLMNSTPCRALHQQRNDE